MDTTTTPTAACCGYCGDEMDDDARDGLCSECADRADWRARTIRTTLKYHVLATGRQGHSGTWILHVCAHPVGSRYSGGEQMRIVLLDGYEDHELADTFVPSDLPLSEAHVKAFGHLLLKTLDRDALFRHGVREG